MRAPPAALALAAASLAAASSPPVHFSLETGWAAPPLALEILETLYDESPNSYFTLLRLLSSLPSDTTPETLLSSTVDLIQAYSLLPPSSLATFNLALSLHSTAPRIEAEYNWYESAVRGQEKTLGVEGCQGWVDWRGKGFCGVEELQRDMELSLEDGSHKAAPRPVSLPFDHVSSTPASRYSPQAVIYYTPSSSSSVELLEYLSHHESQYPDFSYIVRYQPTSQEDVKPLPLAGWGVEMALKNMDYLVVDDRATGKKGVDNENTVVKNDVNDIFSDVFGDDPWSELATPLNPREIRNIGLQAASLIMSSNDSLKALTHLSQDFPKYLAALARTVEVPENILAKGRSIAVRGQGTQAIYINGKPFGTDLNAYSLLKTLREERQLTFALTSLGLTPAQAVTLISDPDIGSAQVGEDVGEGFVDASDRTEGGDVVVWWNDIEKDHQYRNWPSHLQGYLRPLYPGQFHTVRRNAFNLIFTLDISQISSLEIIAGSLAQMVQRGIPIRFGIVPVFEPGTNDLCESFKMAKVFRYVVKTFSKESIRDFFTSIIHANPRNTVHQPIDLSILRAAYDALLSTSELEQPALTLDEVFGSVDEQLKNTEGYLKRLLVRKSDEELGGMFLNGKWTPLGVQWPSIVTQEMASQLSFLQEEIMRSASTIPDDISSLFYDLPTTSPRRSAYIIPSSTHSLRLFSLVDLFEGEVEQTIGADFVYAEGTRGSPLTMWIIGDLDSADAIETVKNGLLHLQSPECSSRLGFIHIPSASSSECSDGYCLSTVLYQLHAQNALSTVNPAELLSLVSEIEVSHSNVRQGEIVDAAGEQKTTFEGKPLHAATFGGWSVADTAAAGEFWKAGEKLKSKLGVTEGVHILVNGRLVGPIVPAAFPAEDFDALELYEHRKRVTPVIDVLQTLFDDITVFDRPTLANLISKTSSVIASAYKPQDAEGVYSAAQLPRTRIYERLDTGDLSFRLGNQDNALLQVAVVVDPLSERAQKWSPLIKALSEIDHVSVTVYLEPKANMEEIKLKRFYRAELPSKLTFDVDGDVIAPGVSFNSLPPTPIYTVALDTPPSWIVSPRASPYDLDNLLLSSISSPVSVLFSLKHLLIVGHAREGPTTPPRGLQLQVAGPQGDVAADTQVMANLGYLQFRAVPGLYSFSIRPGRGQEVYELESVGSQGWDSPTVEEVGNGVALASFEGETIYPRFKRREGMENADVLQESQEPPKTATGLLTFGRMKSMIGLAPSPAPAQKEHADINIFTVASGLLYERFASIMILSVMKHTDSTVKFWFIENFLSPSFIDFIPKLAEEYGFQYEFVTYKWPHWLRAQTEKQRIIWAYKILFLDVLFPMSLDKVIFVDADQIVRTDMKELVDVDLHGRVYGYAPMGNSRTEMEGFRFWKSGYWKEALRGRPYHISALYVVDLKRFRQLATGDRLRGQYHALSADPNSLANLDQDLPNSMQDHIPIWTLSQDWLWCQTWCSDESLSTAKTIDLCQNPLTKEPKLVRARQIPEWDVYDREIAAFAARVSGDGDESGALAASVDELASEANADSSVEAEVVESDGRIVDEL
ncbi:hypothetical protein I350_00211 [Cryptococcus amylolentus CBS 6273]|uniref:UDP-glucose:glycoprotein glucosyltransferase n=1 Tax=Cryptococcus amylolentus CBS 6273 TaxID=1296118 RepID=A0A1E3KEB0_9TREE|nr:hypothetical protein I350_00211 [Cryptococcus amylolentus CBS 6273]